MTLDDDRQYDIFDDFADDVVDVCRGRSESDFPLSDILKNGASNKADPSDVTLNDILIERFENDIIVRSRRCNYIIRFDPRQIQFR